MPRSKGRPQPPTPPSPGWQESAGQAHRVRRVRREQPRARPPPAGAGFASNQSPRFTRVAIGSPARRQLSAPVRTTRNKGALGMGWACLGGPLGLPPGTLQAQRLIMSQQGVGADLRHWEYQRQFCSGISSLKCRERYIQLCISSRGCIATAGDIFAPLSSA